VIAAPKLMAAAATDVATIGSTLSAANVAPRAVRLERDERVVVAGDGGLAVPNDPHSTDETQVGAQRFG
jgi:hypothetical protein